jgi:hypothetical protein
MKKIRYENKMYIRHSKEAASGRGHPAAGGGDGRLRGQARYRIGVGQQWQADTVFPESE